MSHNDDLWPETTYKKRMHEIFDSFLELLPKSFSSAPYSELNRITHYLNKIYDSKDIHGSNNAPSLIINHFRIHNIDIGPILTGKKNKLETVQKPIHSNKFLKKLFYNDSLMYNKDCFGGSFEIYNYWSEA